MNRERWASFPAVTEEERGLLRAIDGASARREVAVVAADGRVRALAATLSIEVAEPLDGKADVVVRLAIAGAGASDGERPAIDPWALLDQFLSETAAEARRIAADER